MRLSMLALVAALLAAGGPALAAPACVRPAALTPAPVIVPRADEVVSGVTTAYYLLALSWTPQWCRSGGAGASAKEMECGQAFGFSLHGLWPDGAAKPYPRFCRPVGALDASTVVEMYCRTPSPKLLQHEWQAHGACGWNDPKAYFGQASRLYDRLVMPRIEAIAPDALTAGAVRAAFVARNPGLARNQVFVQTDRSDDLTEVRICYDLKFRPAACPGGTGTPDRVRLHLAPSRTGAF
ncbi:ribonuclease T [Phenylobacterium sp.]|uniref:ribonuclease T2 family protein n=1 Tax=Phenylobacterium sp. TaxID=1871053 RepID=UPI00356567AE